MTDNLTTGERLTILRRRNNLTQADIATKYSVSQMTVSMWETNAVQFPGIVNEIQDLHGGERCYVLRRRLKLRVKETARELGVSHVTLLKWERHGPSDDRYKDYLLNKAVEVDMEAIL